MCCDCTSSSMLLPRVLLSTSKGAVTTTVMLVVQLPLIACVNDMNVMTVNINKNKNHKNNVRIHLKYNKMYFTNCDKLYCWITVSIYAMLMLCHYKSRLRRLFSFPSQHAFVLCSSYNNTHFSV